MNNLTTRKIVLGLLMVLVLAFSVQGIADALSTLSKTDSTDVQTTNTTNGASHTFSFSVSGVQNYVLDTDGNIAGNQTQVGDVVTVTVSGGAIVTSGGGAGQKRRFRLQQPVLHCERQGELDMQASIGATEAALTIGGVNVVCRPSGAGELTLTVTHTSRAPYELLSRLRLRCRKI